MIPQDFEYSAPASLKEALELIATGERKILAGGMSLIPLMKLRLAAPEHVVDPHWPEAAPPAGIGVRFTVHRTVALEWDAVPGASHYVIRWAGSPTSPIVELLGVVGTRVQVQVPGASGGIILVDPIVGGKVVRPGKVALP